MDQQKTTLFVDVDAVAMIPGVITGYIATRTIKKSKTISAVMYSQQTTKRTTMSKKLEAQVEKIRAEYRKIQGLDKDKETKPKVIFHNSKYQDAFSSAGSVTSESVANNFWT